MTDVIHKVLNDITVDDWDIIIGGDSHTRMSKGVAFGADSGTVALALATGEATMPIPESVKVTFKGRWPRTWTSATWSTPPRRRCSSSSATTSSRAA
jgi:aconitase B